MGLGLTTWSPLASGLLTGKYRQGVPKDSRGARKDMDFLVKSLTDEAKNTAVAQLEAIAKELDCTVGQLAIAWAACNPRVSTVITGASKVDQLEDNLGSLDVIARLSPEVLAQIDKITKPLAD